MNFDQAFHQLLGHEGGYSDNKADPGGLPPERGGDFGERLPSSQSQLDGVAAASPDCRPFCDRAFTAVHGESSGRPEIVGLLAGRRPSAVPGLVVARVVNSIKRAARRLRPHVGKELFERFFPFSTNGNASTAPQVESRAALIQAPILHARPRLVLGRVAHAMRFPLRNLLFAMEASAGGGLARGEPCRRHLGRSAAIAEAGPASLRLPARFDSRVGLLNDYETGKPFADQIEGISHAV